MPKNGKIQRNREVLDMVDQDNKQKEQVEIDSNQLDFIPTPLIETPSLARLLGKSEDNLKREFYLYKVKELMINRPFLMNEGMSFYIQNKLGKEIFDKQWITV